MCTAQAMASTYEQHRSICQYVHSTSRGHEAIQLATAFHIKPCDYVSPYYRDESLLLGLGYSPYQLMLQLLAKAEDPFSAGRSYYAHPNARNDDFPTMIHQSSATGMQAIPTTGIAQGLQYLSQIQSPLYKKCDHQEAPIVICSLGDASVTEGEISEAFQVAVLKQLPIIYLVQDNQWGISVTAGEARAMDVYEYAAGFKGMNRVQINGSDFVQAFEEMRKVVEDVRTRQVPYIVQANVPLLGHHTSGVRKEFYRDAEDWIRHSNKDPLPILKNELLQRDISSEALERIEQEAIVQVQQDFENACNAADPDPATLEEHIFADTPVTEERGRRIGDKTEKIPMVDAALFAIQEILQSDPHAILYGQDVGRRLGGVFREAATLAEKFGDHRVFNTAIQEAYIIGSTVGLNAAGIKPIVEVQFGDYLFPGMNQLVIELAKSCYLTAGKFPVQTLIRVPVGAYGGGGPYHSASIESMLLAIKGIKIVFPSNAADMKGLMKAAFLDPNPVIVLEHKGLYWSKVPGTEKAKTPEPDQEYIIPLGKAAVIQQADEHKIKYDNTCLIITYGMGVYWSLEAAKHFPGQVTIIDLRTLFPLDETLLTEQLKQHGKCLIVSEEPVNHSFAESLAGKLSKTCFQYLDAPVDYIAARNLPAVPLNKQLEKEMLPNAEKVAQRLGELLNG